MKLLLIPTLSVFLAAAVYAQNPPRPTQDQQDTPATTVTGCLTKGESAGQYMITDSKSGEKIMFAGPDRLDNYVNHTVELTGRMVTQQDGKAFQPRSIKNVSDSCGGGR